MSVVCAVAVREGNDIIVIDVCESNKKKKSPKIFRRLFGGGAVMNVGYNGKAIYVS